MSPQQQRRSCDDSGSASVSASGALSVSYQYGERGAVAAPQFLEGVVQVDLDRALRDGEPARDVLIRQPLRNQASNLVLPDRQHPRKLNILLAALGCAPDRRSNDLLRQPTLARRNDPQTLDQGVKRMLLQQEAPSAPLHRRCNLLVCGRAGEKDHAGGKAVLLERLQHLQPGEL